jgi:dolichol-phosphate mannosyltransferase
LKVLIVAAALPNFGADQLVAALAAMTSNFLLNNEVTYREYRYRGRSVIGGLLLFALVCSVGVVANINIAAWLFDFDQVWWVAGVAGALVGVVWNYAVSSAFVWRGRRSK